MLTAADVARTLGISARAVYDLAASGAIPTYRFGRAVRFDPADVEAYRARQPQAANAGAALVAPSTLRKLARMIAAAEKDGADGLPELTADQRAIAESRYRRMISPPWADRQSILAVYAEAKRLTLETGILHHVDHIIPLQGELVSGLHVAENLRAIPAAENLRKRNRYEP